MCEYICAVYACRIGLYRCHICRCVAYGYAAHILFSHFSTADPKKGSSGSAFLPPARSGPVTQDVAVFSAEDDAICCVPPLPRDRPLTTGKRRFAYSLTVVHFRKLRYT
ncbi:TPA: hypothetical protein MFM33_005536 [Klebsiella pneumoniae]|nr:hypothetical protein [Klebsiella pneumoniae]